MTCPHLPLTALAIVALIAGRVDPAWAEQPGLESGRQALMAGHAPKALTLLTTELQSASLSLEDRARTLYFRAKAYYATQQPALAMADAGAALWLNKLSPAEAADAEQLKARAQQSALNDPKLPAVATIINRPPPPAAAPVQAAAVVPPAAPVAPAPVAPPAPGAAPPKQAPAPQAALALPAPIPVRPPAPAWSAAAVQREVLPHPAPVASIAPPTRPLPAWSTNAPVAEPAAAPLRPVLAWMTNGPVAEPQAQRTLETGSITRADQQAAQPAQTPPPAPLPIVQAAVAPPAPLPAPVTKQPEPAALLPAPAVPPAPPADAALVPKPMTASVLPDLASLGGLFKPQPSPMEQDVERANDFQRSYAERIRRYNAERAANPKLNVEN